MEHLRRAALADIPDGYVRVSYGDIKPTDLVWNWVGEEWLSADDPSWTYRAARIEHCVCVVRRGFKKPPPPPEPAPLVEPLRGQGDLFA